MRATGTAHRPEGAAAMNSEILNATARAIAEERLRTARLRREALAQRAEARRRAQAGSTRRGEGGKRFGRAA